MAEVTDLPNTSVTRGILYKIFYIMTDITNLK